MPILSIFCSTATLTRAVVVSHLGQVLTEHGMGRITGGGAWLDGSEFDIEIETADVEATLSIVETALSALGGIEITSAVASE